MWQRLSLYDLRVIGHYLGVLILFTTIGLAAPLLTSILFGEWQATERYFLTIGIFRDEPHRSRAVAAGNRTA